MFWLASIIGWVPVSGCRCRRLALGHLRRESAPRHWCASLPDPDTVEP